MVKRFAIKDPNLYRAMLHLERLAFELFEKMHPELLNSVEFKKRKKSFLKKVASYRPSCGMKISDAISELIQQSKSFNIRVIADFNDIAIIANPKDSEEDLVRYYEKASTERSDRYVRSFKWALATREAKLKKEEENERRAIIEDWLSRESLQIKKGLEKGFENLCKLNSSAYGRGIIDFAVAWGVAMQRSMRNGKKISEVAEELGRYTDVWGMSGFSRSKAIEVLKYFWRYGNSFEKWYNLKYPISNKDDSTLNISILHISL